MENENITEIDKVGPIPRYYHESEVARLERTITRLFWALIMTILLLVGTNAGWIIYEAQWEDTVVTQDVDTGDGAAIVTGVGDIYGEGQTNSQDAQTQDGR